MKEKELESLVKENLVKTWLSGKGGISDSKFDKIYEKKFEPLGYTFDEVNCEFQKQIDKYF